MCLIYLGQTWNKYGLKLKCMCKTILLKIGVVLTACIYKYQCLCVYEIQTIVSIPVNVMQAQASLTYKQRKETYKWKHKGDNK